MGMEEITVLVNATVLSNFGAVGAMELLREAVEGKGGTTQEVWEEYQRGVELGRLPPTCLDWLPRLVMNEEERRTFEGLCQRLGKGEASCIAVAFHRGFTVATDDRDARRIAQQMGLKVTGTLGILVHLVRAKRVSLEEANRLLEGMAQRGFFSPVSDIATLL
jgi:predicted nucleic acid-binding protein